MAVRDGREGWPLLLLPRRYPVLLAVTHATSPWQVLKTLAKPLKPLTPVDYYVVCCELEDQLANEFDFVQV